MGLILLRHTAPEVAPGTCYGQLDLPVAPGFEAEAAAIEAALPSVRRIVTSPLQRCRSLAAHLGRARGMAVEVEPCLTEIDFGRWEGQPWDGVPRGELDLWAGDFWGARPHGGDSVAGFTRRVAGFLADEGAGGGTLAVTHAGVMRAAIYLLGRDEGWQRRFAYGEWLVLTPEDRARIAGAAGSIPGGEGAPRPIR